MPRIEKLRYVRLGLDDLEAAGDFLTRIVGLQRIAAPEGLALFRADEKDPSVIVHRGAGDEALALQLRTVEALAEMTARLEAAGYAVVQGTAAESAERKCKAFASFRVRGSVRLELVVRPMDSGWRYFGSRDAGITEFFGVSFATTDVEADIRLWTEILGGRVADYIGDGAYIAIDDEHHRIALYPSDRDAMLEVQFRVEGLHQLMQSYYVAQGAQVGVAHGPGRRAASEQLFLTLRGPGRLHFGYVAEGTTRPFDVERLPRQFPRRASSFCTWGSEGSIPEMKELAHD